MLGVEYICSFTHKHYLKCVSTYEKNDNNKKYQASRKNLSELNSGQWLDKIKPNDTASLEQTALVNNDSICK